MATRIARRHGLRWYGADTRTWQHRDRALRAGNAAARRWEAMTPEDRWARSTPSEMLELSLHTERGAMALDDLRALPESPLVIAEGSVLPARAVSSGIADPSRAVWLLPTSDFQRATLAARGTPPGPTALYRLLRDVIARDASEHSAPTLIVDGSRDLEATVAAVEELFSEALAEGPRAETCTERQALLREANEAIAAQVRAYYARPWAEGDAESVVRELVCECGATSCDARVRVPVGALADAPLLSQAHR
ncbi:MAG TPA: hypothetical protein VE596_09750 [Gaiellaceae bacterium]|nr:hypothetical protein [Gaiellaceae bacterium]